MYKHCAIKSDVLPRYECPKFQKVKNPFSAVFRFAYFCCSGRLIVQKSRSGKLQMANSWPHGRIVGFIGQVVLKKVG